jgi:hypothetical protein
MEVMCQKLWMSLTPTLSMPQLNQDPRAFWVDMRGGNKLNVQTMARFFDISQFEKIYANDIYGPLFEMERKNVKQCQGL